MSTSSKLKKLLKNEWIRTGIMLAIILIAFFSFWFGIRDALATEYPLLAVASGSMEPTLDVGDLIVVHGISNASEIYAHPVIVDSQTGNIIGGGDIIIFHTYLTGGPNLRPGQPDDLIVHRAINKTLKDDSYTGRKVWYFITKGDHNPTSDPGTVLPGGPVPEYYVVGKVVGLVRYVGYIPLFVRTSTGIAIVLVLIILVLCLELVYSAYKEKRKLRQEVQS
jgi:signal peptidase I